MADEPISVIVLELDGAAVTQTVDLFGSVGGCRVTPSRSKTVAAAADALVIPSLGNLDLAHGTLRADRWDELVDRRLAGGRDVLALGHSAALLFDDPARPALAQWPGQTHPVPAGRYRLAGSDPTAGVAGVLDGQSVDLAARRAPLEWHIEARGPYSPVRVVRTVGRDSFLVAVENGPLVAIGLDLAWVDPTDDVELPEVALWRLAIQAWLHERAERRAKRRSS